jgi:hypothetical protein
MGKQRTDKADRYFQVHHYMLKTDAWRALSAPARTVYLQIGFRYDGFNNGKIALSVRDAEAECNINKDTASRAFHELVERGFIVETRHGGLSRKTRLASEWRMTAYKCDLTGAFKTCAFMHRGGPNYSSYTPLKRGPSSVRIYSRECPKKLPSLSESIPADPLECPKQLPAKAVFGGPPVRNNYPHIVYQSQRSEAPAPPDDMLTRLPWSSPRFRALDPTTLEPIGRWSPASDGAVASTSASGSLH